MIFHGIKLLASFSYAKSQWQLQHVCHGIDSILLSASDKYPLKPLINVFLARWKNNWPSIRYTKMYVCLVCFCTLRRLLPVEYWNLVNSCYTMRFIMYMILPAIDNFRQMVRWWLHGAIVYVGCRRVLCQGEDDCLMSPVSHKLSRANCQYIPYNEPHHQILQTLGYL